MSEKMKNVNAANLETFAGCIKSTIEAESTELKDYVSKNTTLFLNTNVNWDKTETTQTGSDGNVLQGALRENLDSMQNSRSMSAYNIKDSNNNINGVYSRVYNYPYGAHDSATKSNRCIQVAYSASDYDGASGNTLHRFGLSFRNGGIEYENGVTGSTIKWSDWAQVLDSNGGQTINGNLTVGTQNKKADLFTYGNIKLTNSQNTWPLQVYDQSNSNSLSFFITNDGTAYGSFYAYKDDKVSGHFSKTGALNATSVSIGSYNYASGAPIWESVGVWTPTGITAPTFTGNLVGNASTSDCFSAVKEFTISTSDSLVDINFSTDCSTDKYGEVVINNNYSRCTTYNRYFVYIREYDIPVTGNNTVDCTIELEIITPYTVVPTYVNVNSCVVNSLFGTMRNIMSLSGITYCIIRGKLGSHDINSSFIKKYSSSGGWDSKLESAFNFSIYAPDNYLNGFTFTNTDGTTTLVTDSGTNATTIQYFGKWVGNFI